VARVAHAYGLVKRNAEPLLDGLGDALAGPEPQQLADFAIDGFDLVLPRALAAQHAPLAVWVPNVERQGRKPLAVLTLQARLPDISLGHAVDGNDVPYLPLQPVQVLVDGFRLPLGVGEDGAVGHDVELT